MNNDSQLDSFAMKYISDGALAHEELQGEIDDLNHTLTSTLNEPIGDLFSNSPSEIEKTIALIRTLLSGRHRDKEQQMELRARLKELDGKVTLQKQQIEKLQREVKTWKEERDSLANELKFQSKNHQEAMDRLTTEKEQLQRGINACASKEVQFKHENKKLETTIISLQERINKSHDKVHYCNAFEVMNQLQTYGPNIIVSNAQNEYNQVVAQSMEETYNLLVGENTLLRDYLQTMQAELMEVITVKREMMKRESDWDEDGYELNKFKPELLNLPLQHSREGLRLLNENVLKFKETMTSKGKYEQKASIGNIKNLIQSYKSVVESQDQLLSKVILKAKQFKAHDMQAIEKVHSQMVGEQELSKAKRFLQEQQIYLQSKNKELESTRKAMQVTMRKAEEERTDFTKRAMHMAEEMHALKRKVETLPTAVERELK